MSEFPAVTPKSAPRRSISGAAQAQLPLPTLQNGARARAESNGGDALASMAPEVSRPPSRGQVCSSSVGPAQAKAPSTPSLRSRPSATGVLGARAQDADGARFTNSTALATPGSASSKAGPGRASSKAETDSGVWVERLRNHGIEDLEVLISYTATDVERLMSEMNINALERISFRNFLGTFRDPVRNIRSPDIDLESQASSIPGGAKSPSSSSSSPRKRSICSIKQQLERPGSVFSNPESIGPSDHSTTPRRRASFSGVSDHSSAKQAPVQKSQAGSVANTTSKQDVVSEHRAPDVVAEHRAPSAPPSRRKSFQMGEQNSLARGDAKRTPSENFEARQSTSWPLVPPPAKPSRPPPRRQSVGQGQEVGPRRRKSNVACEEPEETPVVTATLPPEFKGFELGGRSGNVVVRILGGEDSKVPLKTDGFHEVNIQPERGWKVVAFDFHHAEGTEIKAAMAAARREGRDCHVTFELTMESAKRLGKRVLRAGAAKLRLTELLGGRSLEELELLDETVRGDFLKDINVRYFMFDAVAIFELEVLLGLKSASLLNLALDIQSAVRRRKMATLEGLLRRPGAKEALVQRDSGGNVALHYCQDKEALQMILEAQPEALNYKNKEEKLPLHCYVQNDPFDDAGAQLLASDPENFFLEDHSGICPAMFMASGSRRLIHDIASPWQDMEAALGLETRDVLHALGQLRPKGSWKGLLSFYCFGEQTVWKDGYHTEQSTSRLLVVWNAMRTALDAVADRDHTGVPVARALLEATRGPRHEGSRLDPRQPFRRELSDLLAEVEYVISTKLGEDYEEIKRSSDPTASWLINMPNNLRPDAYSEMCVSLNLQPRLQLRAPLPQWFTEPDTKAAFEDLSALGVIGDLEKKDAAYDLLCLAGCHLEEFVPDDEKVLARFYAAYLRGIHSEQSDRLYGAVRRGFGAYSHQDGAFSSRASAKTLTRMWEKMREEMKEFVEEKMSVEVKPADWSSLTKQVASFICDICGCTFVAENEQILQGAFAKVERSGLNVVRTKNGFWQKTCTIANANYRDLKLWIEHPTPRGPLIVEVQMQLKKFADEKRWMHLPYTIRRGSYDWPHVTEMLKAYEREDARMCLRKAMETEVLIRVRRAVRVAQVAGLDESEINEANIFVEKLIQDTKLKLQEAISKEHYGSLLTAISFADGIGLEVWELQEARLRSLQVKEKAEEKLRQASTAGVPNQLILAIRDAQNAGVFTDELNNAEQLLAEIRSTAVDLLTRALNDDDINGLFAAMDAAHGACLEDLADLQLMQQAEGLLKTLKEESEEKLTEAMAAENPRILSHAIRNARYSQVRDDLISEAEKVLERCCASIKEQLGEATNSKSLDDLPVILERARDACVDEESIKVAESVLSHLMHVKAELRRATEDKHLPSLEMAMRNARAERFGIHHVEEAQTVLDELKSLRNLHSRKLKDAIRLATSAKKITGLPSAIAKARESYVDAAQIKEAEDLLGQCHLQRSEALELLQSAIESANPDMLTNALRCARRAGIEDSDKHVWKANMIFTELLSESQLELKNAIDEQKPALLMAAIRSAARFSQQKSEVARAEQLLKDIRTKAVDTLEKAKSERRRSLLNKAIDCAQHACLEQELIEDAKHLLLQIRRDEEASTEDVRKRLVRALESSRAKPSYVDDLLAAISAAQSAGACATELLEAEQVLAEVRLLKRDAQAFLRQAVEAQSLRRMAQAIPQAANIGIREREIEQALKLKEEIGGKVYTTLREAIDNHDDWLLLDAVRNARRHSLDDSDELCMQAKVRMLELAKSKLREAMSGKAGNLRLIDAIKYAERAALQEEEIAPARERQMILSDNAYRRLQQAIESKIPADLLEAIRDARVAGLPEKHMLHAAEVLAYLQGITQSPVVMLKKAMDARRLDMLREAIDCARRSGGFENSPELTSAENLLQQMEEERKVAENLLLTAAKEEEDIDELWKRIQEANRAGVDESTIEPARIKLVRLERQKAESSLQAAIANPGVEELSHAISRAAIAGFADPELLEARALLARLKTQAARRLLSEALETRSLSALSAALELAREVDLEDEPDLLAAEDLLMELNNDL